ncbi:MAG: hypothetical protein NT005_02725 [Spirochaetes bacterium]|nr:hypothetical protein [Spirochaetota bacterium]
MAPIIGNAASGFTLPKYGGVGNYTFDSSCVDGANPKIAILSFIDIKKVRAWAWLRYLEDCAALNTASVLRLSVIYHGDTDSESFGGSDRDDTNFDEWIEVKRLTYGNLSPSGNSLWLKCMYHDPTAGLDDYETIKPAYLDILAGYVTPAIYIVRPDFTVVDAFHYSSVNNGNDSVSAPWRVDDLIDFNWADVTDFAGAKPTYFIDTNPDYTLTDFEHVLLNKIVRFAVARSDDLQNPQPVMTVAPPSGTQITDGAQLTVTFSGKVSGTDYRVKKAVGARKSTSYLLGPDSAHITAVANAGYDLDHGGKYPVSDYLNGIKENLTLTLGNALEIHAGSSLDFSPVAASLLDTGGRPFFLESPVVYPVRADVSDVYLRDNIDDTGDPHDGPIAWSPDVILKQHKYPTQTDAQNALGDATWNRTDLCDMVTRAHSNWIYIRAYNRGAADAGPGTITATVYWSEPSLLPTPDQWNPVLPVATVTFGAMIPAGRAGLIVSPALEWTNLPTLLHNCFIATIDNPGEPAPTQADLIALVNNSWSNYITLIRDSHWITWRNFDVDDSTTPPPSPPSHLHIHPLPGFHYHKFRFPGAPGKRMIPMDLEITPHLPEGAEVALDIPLSLLEHFPAIKLPYTTLKPFARFTLSLREATRFLKVKLPPGLQPDLWIWARIPRESQIHQYSITLRQLTKGKEVGRITWVLRPKKPPFMPGYHRTYPGRKAADRGKEGREKQEA